MCNNFSTTAELCELIYVREAEPSAVFCFLNRSTEYDRVFSVGMCDCILKLPIIALVRQEIKEYRQDHPEVSADVKVGNVVWKPKDKWAQLLESMK